MERVVFSLKQHLFSRALHRSGQCFGGGQMLRFGEGIKAYFSGESRTASLCLMEIFSLFCSWLKISSDGHVGNKVQEGSGALVGGSSTRASGRSFTRSLLTQLKISVGLSPLLYNQDGSLLNAFGRGPWPLAGTLLAVCLPADLWTTQIGARRQDDCGRQAALSGSLSLWK